MKTPNPATINQVVEKMKRHDPKNNEKLTWWCPDCGVELSEEDWEYHEHEKSGDNIDYLQILQEVNL